MCGRTCSASGPKTWSNANNDLPMDTWLDAVCSWTHALARALCNSHNADKEPREQDQLEQAPWVRMGARAQRRALERVPVCLGAAGLKPLFGVPLCVVMADDECHAKRSKREDATFKAAVDALQAKGENTQWLACVLLAIGS